MGNIASLLIADRHRRLVYTIIWAVAFVALSAAATWLLSAQIHANLRAETDRALAAYIRVHQSMLGTFDAMDGQLTAQPCSPEYNLQQRRIAFLPDGINELFYASNNAIVCSGNAGLLPVPLDLGPPDLKWSSISFWFNKDLEFMGLAEVTGTIAVRGAQGMVVPRTPLPDTVPRWLDVEVILRAPNGAWWHSAGMNGLYAEMLDAPAPGVFGLRGGAFIALQCDSGGLHCLVARSALSDLFALGSAIVVLIAIVNAVLAAWLARHARAWLARYWSFEARFLRRFRSSGVVCAYQPLLDLHRNRVAGCEVLVRWRDVDGTLVFPDQFLPIIEKHKLTQLLTRKVIDQALRDLLPIPSRRPLQVNINIFPQDLNGPLLVDMLAGFLALGDRFAMVVELVESGEVQTSSALAAMETLSRAGVATYIDDFGTGYSSIHTLAELPVAGVKLDRSFAMAPDGSVLAQMLWHAIDMAHSAGRTLVVEGVETAERLDMLRRSGLVDLAQGYHISRPLDAARFADIVSSGMPAPALADIAKVS